MNQSDAQGLKQKHGTIVAAARAAGMAKSTFADVLAGKYETGAGQHPKQKHAASAQPTTARVKGRSLSEFRQTFDKDFIVPNKIKTALASLGKDGWEYEVGFAKLAGLSMADLGNYREKFLDFVVTIRERRAWAGSKQLADKMRSMV